MDQFTPSPLQSKISKQDATRETSRETLLESKITKQENVREKPVIALREKTVMVPLSAQISSSSQFSEDIDYDLRMSKIYPNHKDDVVVFEMKKTIMGEKIEKTGTVVVPDSKTVNPSISQNRASDVSEISVNTDTLNTKILNAENLNKKSTEKKSSNKNKKNKKSLKIEKWNSDATYTEIHDRKSTTNQTNQTIQSTGLMMIDASTLTDSIGYNNGKNGNKNGDHDNNNNNNDNNNNNNNDSNNSNNISLSHDLTENEMMLCNISSLTEKDKEEKNLESKVQGTPLSTPKKNLFLSSAENSFLTPIKKSFLDLFGCDDINENENLIENLIENKNEKNNKNENLEIILNSYSADESMTTSQSIKLSPRFLDNNYNNNGKNSKNFRNKNGKNSDSYDRFPSSASTDVDSTGIDLELELDNGMFNLMDNEQDTDNLMIRGMGISGMKRGMKGRMEGSIMGGSSTENNGMENIVLEGSSLEVECDTEESDDESTDIFSYKDRIRNKRYTYDKFVGHIFENVSSPHSSGKEKNVRTSSFRTFMINGMIRMEGKKQLYFIYYDVTLHPRGPPSRQSPDGWTICPCRHIFSKTSQYRLS